MAAKASPRPTKSAAKAVWVAHVVKAHGAVRSDAAQVTKAKLIELCDAAEAADAVGPPPQYGMVETATRRELSDLHLDQSALAASAVTMARRVDEDRDVAAARELRMTLAVAKSVLVNPSAGAAAGDEDEDGTVVGPNRLQELRKAANDGTKKSRRSRAARIPGADPSSGAQG